MAERGIAHDLSAIPDAELDARLQTLTVDLAIAESKIQSSSTGRRRARKVVRGVVLNVAGLLFAASTSGVTLLICVAGVKDMVDVFEEDAAAMKLQTQLRHDAERYNELYERIAVERAYRGRPGRQA